MVPWKFLYLLPFAVGQVTLSQHEATGADVNLAPRADQTHVLLRDNTVRTGFREDGNRTESLWKKTYLKLTVLTVGHQTLWELEAGVTGPTGKTVVKVLTGKNSKREPIVSTLSEGRTN